MAGLLGRIARRSLGPVGRIGAKVAGTVFRASPLGAAVGLAAGGFAAYQSLMGGRGGGGVPQLPPMTGIAPGVPFSAMDAGAGQLQTTSGAMGAMQLQIAGKRSFAMPELTIEMIRQLEAAGLMTGFSQLRTYHRSPRPDHVVVHPVGRDGQVSTFALHKKLARAWGLWKPAAKPPMSVGMHRSILRANAARKVITSLNSDMKKIANFGRAPHKSREVTVEIGGKKVIGRLG